MIRGHLSSVETGLTLVLEDLDLSRGRLGAVEGLARDVLGAPVFVLVATDEDPLLLPRALSACAFAERMGRSLASALPEASLAPDAVARVIVVGGEVSEATLVNLLRLREPRLSVCRFEFFRAGSVDRLAVHAPAAAEASSRASMTVADPDAGAGSFAVAPGDEAVWQVIVQMCSRIDPTVRVGGDRYARRISWNGRVLGEVQVTPGGLTAKAGTSPVRRLHDVTDARLFGDQIVREYLAHAGLAVERGAAATADVRVGGDCRAPAGGGMVQPEVGTTLRSTLSGARVSPEEYSALNGPARDVGLGSDAAAVADDVARIVAAQERPWSGTPMRTD